MGENVTTRHCEVPGCPKPAGYGLRVCKQHLREPAAPKDRAEALAYLRERLARYERLWIDPDTADSLALHGSYDIAALRLVVTGGRDGIPAGGKLTFETVYCEVDDGPAPT
jgi:hypothetical protein